MILSQTNVFHKGISADTDYSKRSNDVWDFPSMNIRIMNKEGKGFIITNVDGNTNPNTSYGEDHVIHLGYRVIGACEYNGIAYICSFNESNSHCEIGCFPSPDSLDYTGTNTYNTPVEFQRVYRPLRNFTTATAPYSFTTPRLQMNTTLFDWDMEHQIDIFAREDYDDTVNLYFCDWKNPNRVINSGFDKLGAIKNRLYNQFDFFTNINQILATGTKMKIELNKVEAGGQIQYGNNIYYFRYLTQNLDATTFVAESKPVQIFGGKINDLATIQGGNEADVSDKKVTFNVSDIDNTYTFIEIAYTRYYGDASGVQLSDLWLIDKKFPISGTTSMIITIDGNENLIPIDIAEILKNSNVENCCKSHLDESNMYFGANWKGIDINNEALAYLAQKIQTTYDDTLTINGSSYYTHEHDDVDPIISSNPGQYKDYMKTNKNVGYFRIEAYPFAVVFHLQNGSTTSAYPVTSFDEIDPTTPIINGLGIHRFPRQYFSHIMDGQLMKVMGIKFNCASAWNMLTAPSNATETLYADWIKRNVKAIKFVRGERIENLLYQGFGMNVSNAMSDNQDDIKFTQQYSQYWEYDYDADLSAGVLNTSSLPQHWSADQDDISRNLIGTTGSIGQVPFKAAGSQFSGGGSSGYLYHSWWGSDIRNYSSYYENNPDANTLAQDCMYAPIYRGYTPMTFTLGTKRSCNYVTRFVLKKDYLSIYSPDNILNPGSDVSAAKFIEKQANVSMREIQDIDLGITDIFPHNMLADIDQFVSYDTKASSLRQSLTGSDITMVGKTTTSFPDNTAKFFNSKYFVNAAKDYWTDDSPIGTLFYIYKYNQNLFGGTKQIWSNRSMIMKDYILFKWKDAYTIANDDYNHSIINIYKQDPELITISGLISNIASQTYYQISDNIQLFDNTMTVIPNNFYTLYRGDCFLQRTYIKQMLWNCSGIDLDSQAPVGCSYVDTGAGETVWDWVDTDRAIPKRYTHGLVLGIVTENKLNTAMRYADGTFEYYPHEPSLFESALKPFANGGQESHLYNAGHHGVLSQKNYVGYDITLPDAVTKFPTRIRHSNYHIPFSFVDGYRLFDASSYKDYDLRYGQINAIQSMQGTIISIQEHAINQHFNNEKQLKSPTTSGDLILGMGPILDQNVKQLSTFGSQHQWSVKSGFAGIYGVDFMDKVIWQVTQKSDYGTKGLVANSLPLSASIEKWMYELSDIIDERTDIVTKYADHPVLYEGIVTGVDKKFYEVLFTFHFRTNYAVTNDIEIISCPIWAQGTFYPKGSLINDNGQIYICIITHTSGSDFDIDISNYWKPANMNSIHSFEPGTVYENYDLVCCCLGETCYIYVVYRNVGPYKLCTELGIGELKLNRFEGVCNRNETYDDYSKTLVFNELINAFTCEYSFKPPFYYNIYKDLFSERQDSNYIYRHNQKELPNTFYGTTENVLLSFIVNGADEKQSSVKYMKTYLSNEIEMDHHNLLQVDYSTQYQQSVHNWITDANKPYLTPQYLEHKWVFPVNVQTTVLTDAFDTNTSMRGKWMKTTLTYQGTDRIEIKNHTTNFILSLS